MWIPPLTSSNTIITAYLKHYLAVFVGPFIQIHTLMLWFQSIITQPFDGWDFVWYNNSEAVGNQLYPRGIHLFYDFYSFAGHWTFFFDYWWFLFCTLLSPFTLFIPFNLWTNWLFSDTTQWDLVFLLFYSFGGAPFAFTYCTFKFCEVEKGW